jgi:hypothetical protein
VTAASVLLLTAVAGRGALAQLTLDVLPASQTATAAGQTFTYDVDLVATAPVSDAGGFQTTITTPAGSGVVINTAYGSGGFQTAATDPFTGVIAAPTASDPATANSLPISEAAFAGQSIAAGTTELGSFQVTDSTFPSETTEVPLSLAAVGADVSNSQVLDFATGAEDLASVLGATLTESVVTTPPSNVPEPGAFALAAALCGQAGVLLIRRQRRAL